MSSLPLLLLVALLAAPAAHAANALELREYAFESAREVVVTSRYQRDGPEARSDREAADADRNGVVSAAEAASFAETQREAFERSPGAPRSALQGEPPRRARLEAVHDEGLEGPVDGRPLVATYTLHLTFPRPDADRPLVFERTLTPVDAGPWSLRLPPAITLARVEGLADAVATPAGVDGLAGGEPTVAFVLVGHTSASLTAGASLAASAVLALGLALAASRLRRSLQQA